MIVIGPSPSGNGAWFGTKFNGGSSPSGPTIFIAG